MSPLATQLSWSHFIEVLKLKMIPLACFICEIQQKLLLGCICDLNPKGITLVLIQKMDEIQLMEYVEKQTFISIKTFNLKKIKYQEILDFVNTRHNSLLTNEFSPEKLNNLKDFLKYNILISQTSFDLSIILKYLIILKEGLEYSFFEKKGLSVCYEYQLALGKMIRAVREITDKSNRQISNDLKNILERFTKFKTNFEIYSTIKDIRNKISYHYDPDFLGNNDISSSLKKISTSDMIGELNQIGYSILFLIHEVLKNEFDTLKRMRNANKNDV